MPLGRFDMSERRVAKPRSDKRGMLRNIRGNMPECMSCPDASLWESPNTLLIIPDSCFGTEERRKEGDEDMC